MLPEQKETTLLEKINNSPDLTQRDLADYAGLSLGLTNAVLKRFAEKGWVCLQRFSARHIKYFITPEGLKELSKRGLRYIKRTFNKISHCKNEIADFIGKAKHEGAAGINLIGHSDIDFLIQYVCEEENLQFTRDTEAKNRVNILSENMEYSRKTKNTIHLKDVVSLD